MKDYDKLLNEEIGNAHHAIIESDLMISHGISSFLDDDPLQEGPLDTIVGIAKGLGGSLAAMGKNAGTMVGVLFKAMTVDFYNAALLKMLKSSLAESDITDDALDHAKRLKLAEAAIAVPCMWWVWSQGKGTLNNSQTIALRYGENSQDEDVLELVDSLKIKESIDRIALDRLFDGWTMSGDLLLESQSDYLDKDLDKDFRKLLDQAQGEVARAIETADDEDAKEAKDWLQNITVKDLSVLVLSSWIENDTDVGALKVAYEHEGELSDAGKKWNDKFKENMVGRVKRITAMELYWQITNRKGLRDSFGVDRFNTSLYNRYTDFVPMWDKWEIYAAEKNSQWFDFDKLSDYFKDPAQGGKAAAGGSLSAAQPRQIVSAILGHPAFYEAVRSKIGERNLAMAKEILEKQWGEVKDTATKVVMTASLADFNGLPGKVKSELEKVINSDDKMKELWKEAVEENDDEIASRVLAIVRASFSKSVLDMVKALVDEREGNVQELLNEAEAVEDGLKYAGGEHTFKYKSVSDKAWKAYVAMRQQVDNALLKGFETGTPELESEAKKAEEELKAILAAREAEAGGEGEEETAPESGPVET